MRRCSLLARKHHMEIQTDDHATQFDSFRPGRPRPGGNPHSPNDEAEGCSMAAFVDPAEVYLKSPKSVMRRASMALNSAMTLTVSGVTTLMYLATTERRGPGVQVQVLDAASEQCVAFPWNMNDGEHPSVRKFRTLVNYFAAGSGRDTIISKARATRGMGTNLAVSWIGRSAIKRPARFDWVR